MRGMVADIGPSAAPDRRRWLCRSCGGHARCGRAGADRHQAHQGRVAPGGRADRHQAHQAHQGGQGHRAGPSRGGQGGAGRGAGPSMMQLGKRRGRNGGRMKFRTPSPNRDLFPKPLPFPTECLHPFLSVVRVYRVYLLSWVSCGIVWFVFLLAER